LITRCFIGALHHAAAGSDHPANAANAAGGAYVARYLHDGGPPDKVLPALAAIWATTFGRDTAATTTALLAHDWLALAADATETGQQPAARSVFVPGIGHALSDDGPGLGATGRIEADHPGNIAFAYLLRGGDEPPPHARVDAPAAVYVEVYRAAGTAWIHAETVALAEVTGHMPPCD